MICSPFLALRISQTRSQRSFIDLTLCLFKKQDIMHYIISWITYVLMVLHSIPIFHLPSFHHIPFIYSLLKGNAAGPSTSCSRSNAPRGLAVTTMTPSLFESFWSKNCSLSGDLGMISYFKPSGPFGDYL